MAPEEPPVLETRIALLCLVTVEEGDSDADIGQVSQRLHRIVAVAPKDAALDTPPILLMPFVHATELTSRTFEPQLLDLSRKLIDLGDQVVVIPTGCTTAMQMCATLVDDIATTHLTISETSLVNRMAALVRVFSKGTLQRALRRAIAQKEATNRCD